MSRAATLGPETQCPYASLFSAILGRAPSPACKGVREELARFHDHGSRKASVDVLVHRVLFYVLHADLALVHLLFLDLGGDPDDQSRYPVPWYGLASAWSQSPPLRRYKEAVHGSASFSAIHLSILSYYRCHQHPSRTAAAPFPPAPLPPASRSLPSYRY